MLRVCNYLIDINIVIVMHVAAAYSQLNQKPRLKPSQAQAKPKVWPRAWLEICWSPGPQKPGPSPQSQAKPGPNITISGIGLNTTLSYLWLLTSKLTRKPMSMKTHESESLMSRIFKDPSITFWWTFGWWIIKYLWVLGHEYLFPWVFKDLSIAFNTQSTHR